MSDHADPDESDDPGAAEHSCAAPGQGRSYGGVPLDDPDDVNPATTAPAPDLDHEITQFYVESFPRLVALLLYMNVSHADALDCAHGAIAEAVERWEVLRNPYPWCRTTTLRLMYKRSNQQRREVLADPHDRTTSDYDQRAASALADVEQRHHMLSVTKRLSPQQRIIVALTYDGATTAEIASELDLPPATVRSSLSAARQIMRSINKEDR